MGTRTSRCCAWPCWGDLEVTNEVLKCWEWILLDELFLVIMGSRSEE